MGLQKNNLFSTPNNYRRTHHYRINTSHQSRENKRIQTTMPEQPRTTISSIMQFLRGLHNKMCEYASTKKFIIIAHTSNIFDKVMTVYGVKMLGLTEINFLLKPLLIFSPLIALVAIIGVGALLLEFIRRRRFLLFPYMTILSIIVCLNNLFWIIMKSSVL